ncbi:MAG: BamA/TamA family outer membrane protein [Acidobacteria bacterium]|nr:BamA/TamA family outer membrane protein [Acidobacteriota bacterium]
MMRRIMLAIAVFLSAAAAVCQTKVSGEKQPSYEGHTVASVDLVANPRINVESYRPLVVQKAGEPYSQQKVQASIEALEQTNAFGKVELKVEPDPSGLKLRFVLEPAYYIGLLSFPGGLKGFTYTRLLQVANLGDQTLYQQAQLPDREKALTNFFADRGYFQAKVRSEVSTDDQNQLANITFHVQLGRRARIGRVEVSGAPREENLRLERTLRSLRARASGALLKEGKRYSPTRISAAIVLLKKQLGREHHPASRVQVKPPNYHADTNRADISIQVEVGPEVRIKVQGAKLAWLPFLSRRQEKKLIPIYEENSVDPDLVTEGQRNLANYFQQKGYFDVKVSTNYQQQNDRVLLVYNVDKGRKHAVQEINFRGNHHLDNKDLLGQVAIKKRRPFLSRGSFSDKLLRTSVNNIASLYKDHGFEDVRVNPEVVDREPKLYVNFNITEGTRTIVNSLNVQGNKTIPVNELRAKKGFELEEGKPFSPRRLSNDRNQIAAKYLDRGFLNAEVKTVVSRHPDDPHQVDVTYQVNEQQQVHISHVLYLGLGATRKDLIQTSTKLAPEQPLSEGKLLEGESKLYDLGIFDWSSIGPRRQITNQAEEEALIKVHEAKRNTITYGFGFEVERRGGNIPTGSVAVPGLPTIGLHGAQIAPSEKTFIGPRGSVAFTRRNMRGEGETASISLLGARLDQRMLLTYTDPHFRRSENWQALTSLSAERTTENPLFEARLADASLQFQRYLDRKDTMQLQLRYDFNRTKLTKILVPELVLPADRNVDLSYVSSTLIRDTRDKPLDAHHGVFQTVDLRLVPKAFGSSANFTRLLLQDAYYKPMHGLVFANSMRLGLAAPFGGSDVPTSQRFFAGGGTTLRGFPINEAGPVRYVPFCTTGQTNCPQIAVPVGGNQLFIFNSELRYPIPIMDNLGGVVFYDGGNVYRRINFPEFINNFSNTVGVGLRYSTPIGPVRIDIGRNLNPPAGISATQFFITLGQAF